MLGPLLVVLFILNIVITFTPNFLFSEPFLTKIDREKNDKNTFPRVAACCLSHFMLVYFLEAKSKLLANTITIAKKFNSNQYRLLWFNF